MNNSRAGLKRRIMHSQSIHFNELIAKSDLITAIPERILKKVLFRAVAYCRITDRSRISRIATMYERKQRDPAHEWL